MLGKICNYGDVINIITKISLYNNILPRTVIKRSLKNFMWYQFLIAVSLVKKQHIV